MSVCSLPKGGGQQTICTWWQVNMRFWWELLVPEQDRPDRLLLANKSQQGLRTCGSIASSGRTSPTCSSSCCFISSARLMLLSSILSSCAGGIGRVCTRGNSQFGMPLIEVRGTSRQEKG